MRFRRQDALLVICAFGIVMACSSEASAQWRGRYVRRDGLFHVEKYHWGGGITPTGASVINTALTTLVPLAQQVITREEPDALAARGADELQLDRQKLEEARSIRQATEELARAFNISLPETPEVVTPPRPSTQGFEGWENRPDEAPRPLGSPGG